MFSRLVLPSNSMPSLSFPPFLIMRVGYVQYLYLIIMYTTIVCVCMYSTRHWLHHCLTVDVKMLNLKDCINMYFIIISIRNTFDEFIPYGCKYYNHFKEVRTEGRML